VHYKSECVEYQDFNILRDSKPDLKRLNRGTKRVIYWIRAPGELKYPNFLIFYYSKEDILNLVYTLTLITYKIT